MKSRASLSRAVLAARLGVTALIVAQLSCVGPGVQVQADVVRNDIDKARKSGAYQCAPRELAMAETNVDFAENELAEGDFLRAKAHMEIAVTNANAALANSKDCAPKRVLIKTKTDKDGDGILDDVDACPEQPEDKDLFQDEDGCPDPDNDNDGILDPLDKCPNTPGPKENDGCPFGDKDGDGITDNVDECPDAPEDKDGDRDDDGRPDLDTDGDGVEDCIVGCPPTKAQVDTNGKPIVDKDGKPVLQICDKCPADKGPAANGGCPDADRDHDGILNEVDACPDIAGPLETRGCPDKDGDRVADKDDACPDVVGVMWDKNPEWKERNPKGGDGCPPPLTLVVIKKDKIEIKQQVQFDTAKATIKPASAKLLAEVASAVKSIPDLKKIVIEGHTDDVGDDDYNMNLSQERANSVRQWLIDKERVDPGILEAVGFGETRPIASNRTAQGRQQNRRSEFKVVANSADDTPKTP